MPSALRFLLLATGLLAHSGTYATTPAGALLTGDTRLACEALLCLSSGVRPAECTPSLQRYFGITHRRLHEQISARFHFLNLCPSARQDTQMQSLADALSRGAGRCDAVTLNRTLREEEREVKICTATRFGSSRCTWHTIRPISNRMPAHCTAYYRHPYTQLDMPRYHGDPEQGGEWR